MGDPLAMRRQVRFTEQRGRCKFSGITMQYRPASGDINIKQHPVQTTSRESDMAVTQAIPITRHPYANGSYKKMLIDGQWVDAASGKTFETLNPATGEVLATVAEGDAEDINRAVAAARRAFEGPWSKVKPFERQNLLLKLADLVEKNFEELSQLDTLDMGAPISRTRGNKLRVLGMLRYYAGQATALHGETIENSLPGDIFSYTLKEPVGVVGAIIPWNGPLGASVWKIGPAIATGCTVILKPAEEAPLTSLRLAELCMEAGIPPGVVNVVPGYGETAGAALASHPGVDKVAFTGSHVTGQSIVRASAGNLKRVSLELGGKSPDIVFADADLDAAVPGAAMAVFANSGQICSAGTRLFVESTIYDEFVGRVAEFGKKLQVGNGLDPNTQIGPLVSQQQLDRVSGYLDIGQKEGAKALAGGTRLTEGALSKGYFVPPTVFANVQDSMRIAQEEIFGPVISAISFKDSDDLIKRANATTFGLGSGVWTTNVSKAHQVAKSLRAGSVWVNCYQTMDPAVPFGGYKMSGYGRESGKQHLEEYLNVKAVWIKTG
jgi:aldehyde dehydrogenase (NAD+)